MGIKKFLNKIIERKLGKDLGENFEQEWNKILKQDANKTNEDIKKELCDDILMQYRTLLNLLRVKTPCIVKISADNFTTIVIDEKIYDLDVCFLHKDLRATQCLMAIEALFGDLRGVSEDIDQDIAYIQSKLVAE